MNDKKEYLLMTTVRCPSCSEQREAAFIKSQKSTCSNDCCPTINRHLVSSCPECNLLFHSIMAETVTQIEIDDHKSFDYSDHFENIQALFSNKLTCKN